jgi:hypothetical protein
MDPQDVPKRPVDATFGGRREAIAKNHCIAPPIGCGEPIQGFKDTPSQQEYAITGLCQTCQDKIEVMLKKMAEGGDALEGLEAFQRATAHLPPFGELNPKPSCNARWDRKDGEHVTPCHLEHGHTGPHQGYYDSDGALVDWPAHEGATTLCGAHTTIPSGESVSPCHLPKGHTGAHEGYCLGSRAVWVDKE